MTKNISTASKSIISILVVLATLFTTAFFHPLKALADEIHTDQQVQSMNSIWANNAMDYIDDSHIIGELTELRESNVKQFLREDLLKQIAIYPYSVHYMNNGEWADIDNRLQLVTLENGEQVYKNIANSYSVSFAADASSGTLVRIEKENTSISWSIENAVSSEAEIDRADESEQDPMALSNISSVISYSNALNGATVKYKVLPDAVREYFVFESEPTRSAAAEITIKCEGLTPTATRDGQILFCDNDGSPVFAITAPYMTDAAGNVSTDVDISIEEKRDGSGEYVYTITPSSEWLHSSDREYPITIDPDVVTNLSASAILDTYVDEQYPNNNFHSVPYIKVGTLNGYEHICYVKFTPLPELQSGDVVISAQLDLRRITSGNYTGKEIDLYAITSDWVTDQVTWASMPSLSDKITAIALSPGQYELASWNVTDLVKRWYAGENNYGLALRAGDTNNNFTEFYGSEMSYSSLRPAVTITYTNSTGIENTWSYHTQDIRRAGTGYVNDYNGNLVLVHSDASTNSNIMPASINHVFNGNEKDTTGAYGMGWMINYAQTIEAVTLSGVNYYIHTDGDGTEHYYKQEGNTSEYINEDDASMKLTVDSASMIIEDSAHNKLIFNTSGRLVEIKDRNENSLTIAYNAYGRISSITDGAGNAFTFVYSSSKLSKINKSGSAVVKFNYDSDGRLTKITYADNKFSTYSYDLNNNLVSVTNHDGYSIDYTYSSEAPFRVVKVEEHGGTTDGGSLSFEYGWNTTCLTDNLGRANIYQFDNAGQIVSIRDIDGSAQYAAYDDHDGRKTYLSAISKLQKSSLNLLSNSSFESLDAWCSANGTTITSSARANEAYFGSYGLKLTAGNTYYQTVSLEPGETYTVSGYFKGAQGAVLNAAYYGLRYVPVAEVTLNTNNLTMAVNGTATLTANVLPVNASNASKEWTTSNASVVTVNSSGVLTATGVGSAIVTVVAGGHSASCIVEVLEQPVPVTGITLNTYSVQMQVNSTLPLIATVLPQNATNKAVTWSSANPSVVSVNTNGLLSAGSTYGSTFVTATTVDGGYIARCFVTVGDSSSRSSDVGRFGYYDLDGTTVPASSDWQRFSYTFTVPTTATTNNVRIKLSLPAGSSGTVYSDCIMLEKASGANRYNLVENADFTSGLAGWTPNNSSLISAYTTSDTLHPEDFSTGVVKVAGLAASDAKISQTINVSGAQNDRFTFGGWMRADSIPSFTENNTEYGTRKITLTFLNGNSVVNTCDVYFLADCSMWQYASAAAIAEGSYTSIMITADYSHNRNTAYFDGIQLYKDGFCQYYRYNNDNELIESETEDGDTTQYVYDDDGNLTSVTDSDGRVTTYTYDSHGNMLTMTAPDGLSYAYTYDSYGNQLTSKTIDSLNSANFIQTSTAYSANGAYTVSSTDSMGNTSYYAYDQTSGEMTSITDGNGNTTAYTYDNMHRPTSMSSAVGNSTAQIGYTYTGDDLTSITHNGFNYGLTYDAFGNVTGVNVNGDPLTSYSYDYTRGVLAQTTYGNGFVENYIYDEMDRIIEIKHGTATVYRYSYDGEGNLVAVENCLLGVVTSYFYNIDGTLMRAASTDGTEYYYEYVDDMLSKVYQIANGVTWVTEYSYDDNGEPEQITLNSGVTVSDTQDVFGRKTGRQYKDAQNNSILDVALTYLDGASGSKSEYLGSYRNGTDPAYVYTYDGNGNITSVTHGSDVVTYAYDELNQLVRVNDSAANTTTVYSYDLGGNILSKSEYNYTTGTLPNLARETYTYSYDSDWKDLLVNYNGTPITYDENGNPISYRGYDMVWSGRQLRSMSGDEQNLVFAYNENGLRVEKTVNHTPSGSSAYTTRTAYAYSGTQLMAETRYDNSGAEEAVLHYSYDTEGSLVSVNYNGTEYYYLRNGQNDVVGLIDGNGNTVVEYTYDAWGKLLTTTGTYASTLGVDNPFRYRGYYYDEETGLYYLQSRYYDPETCRFINADDVLFIGATGTILSTNLLSYCENNPVNSVDYFGFWTWTWRVRYDGLVYTEEPHGFAVNYNVKFLSKSYCLNVARALIAFVGNNGLLKGMNDTRIAKELFAHAVLFALGGSLLTFGGISLGLSTLFPYAAGCAIAAIAALILIAGGIYLINHSKVINVNNNESSFRMRIYNLIWKL